MQQSYPAGETPEQWVRTKQDPLHFLGYAACPFKPMFKDYFDEVLEKNFRASGEYLRCHIPMGCGDYDAYEDLWKAESLKLFPDVVASLGFGDFFRPSFVERFVRPGHFKSAWPAALNPDFENAGFRDPDGAYCIYAVWPYVMLVDNQRLAGRPRPRRWSDLLDPMYRDDIITNGSQEHRVAEVPLLYFHKEHGEEGLIRLAANIRDFWHPAQMVKTAGSRSGKGAAVYVLPSFFAQARFRPEETPVIWPEDGALTSPIYFLAKATRRLESDLVVESLTSQELGENLSRMLFPSLHPGVDNRLPGGARFKWLGWDYIKLHDLAAVKEHALRVFLAAWDMKRKG